MDSDKQIDDIVKAVADRAGGPAAQAEYAANAATLKDAIQVTVSEIMSRTGGAELDVITGATLLRLSGEAGPTRWGNLIEINTDYLIFEALRQMVEDACA